MTQNMEEAIDYDEYKFTKKELVFNTVIGIILIGSLGMIFFKSIIVCVLLLPFIYFYLKEQKKEKIAKRKSRLIDQFKEAMYALTSALSAGRSVEQAFIMSLKDLKLIYTEDDEIVKEWQLICHKIAMNETVESALSDLADRAKIDDIDSFCNVFVMAKRTGGNLIEILNRTSDIINEKMQIQKEIDVLVAQKKYEQRILSIIIPAMILTLGSVAPDFLEPLYTTLTGRAVMVVALIMYIISEQIGKRIVRIEV